MEAVEQLFKFVEMAVAAGLVGAAGFGVVNLIAGVIVTLIRE